MNYQHKELVKGRWREMSFVEKMANIGREVERPLNWRTKNNEDYPQRALERALELVDLTLEENTNFACLKELARVREAIVDYFLGTNQFLSADASLRKYFFYFTLAARRNR